MLARPLSVPIASERAAPSSVLVDPSRLITISNLVGLRDLWDGGGASIFQD